MAWGSGTGGGSVGDAYCDYFILNFRQHALGTQLFFLKLPSAKFVAIDGESLFPCELQSYVGQCLCCADDIFDAHRYEYKSSSRKVKGQPLLYFWSNYNIL